MNINLPPIVPDRYEKFYVLVGKNVGWIFVAFLAEQYENIEKIDLWDTRLFHDQVNFITTMRQAKEIEQDITHCDIFRGTHVIIADGHFLCQ